MMPTNGWVLWVFWLMSGSVVCREGIAGQLVTQQARERSDLAMTKHRQAALDRDQRATTGMSTRQIYM